MSEMEVIPYCFGLLWIAYYIRAILRIHRVLAPRAHGSTFTKTWLRFWLSPAILKDSVRCTLISMGVFLGIEIARGNKVEDHLEENSETGNF